jgi:pimeloyl-ACP methyl ester carboxylesterase
MKGGYAANTFPICGGYPVTTKEVANCGHFIPEEAPRAMIDQVISMLDSKALPAGER